MRIGFFIHHSMLKAGGIFTYSIGILKLLLNSKEIDSIVIFTTPEVKINLRELELNSKIEFKVLDRESFLNKFRFSVSYFLNHIYTIYSYYMSKSGFLNFLKKLSILLNPYNGLIKRSGISVFHIPIQYSPIYEIDVPVIITMHDLQEFHLPENFSSGERIHRAINNHKAIYDSDKIIVSFNHIKNDIVKYFKVEESKISVCPPPFADNWFTTNQETSWETLANKYSISKKYLLYPAATWQHKNHIRLLEAVKNVLSIVPDIHLICTGNQTNYYSTIQKKIDELRLKSSVKFLGIISEEDLIGLYKNASLVVIPTLYEAGSGPLYEAIRYKVPVICSNITSLPDTIGNDEFLFDPKNLNDLVAKIKIGLTDSEFRRRNIENSISRMEQLGKVDCTINFINTYRKTITTFQFL